MNVSRHGDPPFSIAVLHGGPGAPGSAAALARELGRSAGVLEPIQGAASVDGQVEELHAQLLPLAGFPVALVGWSWGAILGFLYAARFPDRVGRLVLVSSAQFTGTYATQVRSAQRARLDPAAQARLDGLRQSLSTAPDARQRDELLAQIGRLVEQAEIVDPLAADPLEPPLPPAQYAVYERVWAEAARLRDSGALCEAGRSITCPVLALHGDSDARPVAGVRDALAPVLSDFRCVVLPRCGQYPWRERQARSAFFDALRGELGLTSPA